MPEPSHQPRKVTFSLKAPQAQSVQLVGEFSKWQEKPIALKRLKAGPWKATVSLPEGRYEYQFIVDGAWQNDPECPHRAANPFGGENSVCIVA